MSMSTLVFSYKNGVYKKLRLKFPKILEVIEKLAETHFEERLRSLRLNSFVKFFTLNLNQSTDKYML